MCSFSRSLCPTIPFRCSRISLPYVLGSIFAQRKWKTLTCEEHLPKLRNSLASGTSNRWVLSIKRGRCLGRRLWYDDILGGIYLGDIFFATKIDVFLFAPRLGPDRSVKALGTYHFDNISDNDCSVIPQILDTQVAIMDTLHEKTQFCSSHGYATKASVVSTQRSRITHVSWHIRRENEVKSMRDLLTSSSNGFP